MNAQITEKAMNAFFESEKAIKIEKKHTIVFKK